MFTIVSITVSVYMPTLKGTTPNIFIDPRLFCDAHILSRYAYVRCVHQLQLDDTIYHQVLLPVGQYDSGNTYVLQSSFISKMIGTGKSVTRRTIFLYQIIRCECFFECFCYILLERTIRNEQLIITLVFGGISFQTPLLHHTGEIV